MPDPVDVAQRQHAHQVGLIVGLITLPFRIFGVLCGSLLLAIAVECIGMHVFWPDQNWRHAQTMLHKELDQVSTYFTQSMLVQEPGRTTYHLVDRTYDTLFVRTGMLDWINQPPPPKTREDSRRGLDFSHFLHLAYLDMEPYVLAACYTSLTFLVRLVVLCLALPLFLIAAFVGFIDGLVRRDLRRFGAGRESGFLHHRARASVMPLAVLPWVIYLSLPFSLHPLIILLPGAILLSIAVNVTAGSFKKYL
jgi:integrating conjugative element membrane protein (TIGR03747 family)